MEKVLVAGANGTTGKKITDLLLASRDYTPVAMIRKKEQEKYFHSRGIATRLADLEKEEEIAGISEGIEKVIFAAGSGGKNVEGVDRDGAKRLIDEAKKRQVQKFVMLSSIGADEPESGGELQEYLAAKKAADAYLRESGLSYTIVRPGRLTNEGGTHQVRLENKLLDRGTIPREDVAETLVTVLESGLADQCTFELVSGPVGIDNAVRKFDALTKG